MFFDGFNYELLARVLLLLGYLIEVLTFLMEGTPEPPIR
jgi:hypothetical protein